jgi:hypothetical protein
MLTWQGLEKTWIGIYFSDQIWVIKTEYLGWSTLKSNYYQTSIDFELNFFFTCFNTLCTTTFMFTKLDFIHTRICYGFLNENNHQEYLILLVALPISYWGAHLAKCTRIQGCKLVWALCERVTIVGIYGQTSKDEKNLLCSIYS